MFLTELVYIMEGPIMKARHNNFHDVAISEREECPFSHL